MSRAGSEDVCNLGTLDFSTVDSEKFSEGKHIWRKHDLDDEMCQLDEKDDLLVGGETKFNNILIPDDFSKVLKLHFLQYSMVKA